jgi:hypothetical protein
LPLEGRTSTDEAAPEDGLLHQRNNNAHNGHLPEHRQAIPSSELLYDISCETDAPPRAPLQEKGQC